MFKADLDLLARVQSTHGCPSPVVDVGGLERPTIADYTKTIEAMKNGVVTQEEAIKAQHARYLQIHRPMSFLDEAYAIENPEVGGLLIEQLASKYDGDHAPLIGTAVVLSVFEHVQDPWTATEDLYSAMSRGGLVVASVPWMFPEHHGPKDYWRFSPDGLRELFSDVTRWTILECDWLLRIGADEGVLDIRTMRPQAIEAAYIVARAT